MFGRGRIWGSIQRQFSKTKESNAVERANNNKRTVVSMPTSSRFYKRGDDGTFSSGEVSMEEYSGGVRESKPSTCVKEIDYDPKTHICRILFQGGSKYYEYRMTKNEFESFMKATSKGRYVNNVMRLNNRIAGY